MILRGLFNLFRRKADPRAAASSAGQALAAFKSLTEAARKAEMNDRLCAEIGRAPGSWRRT